MRTAKHRGFIPAALGLLIAVLLTVGVYAQGEEELPIVDDSAAIQADLPEVDNPPLENIPPGLIFTEIRLSGDGVVATDTAGIEWTYDFQAGTWLEGEGGPEGGTTADRRHPQDEMPIDMRATQRREVQAIEQSITVGYDEYVDGSIIAAGRVTIKGWVKGDVRSLNKRVLIAESGRVDGDVEAPSVVIAPGGEVLGRVTETGAPLDIGDLREAISVGSIVSVTAITLVLMFIGFLTVAVIPKPLDRFGACIAGHRVRCYALGFLFVVLLPVVIILCIITIVGILLAPFVPLIYLAAMALGFIAFAGEIGQWAMGKLARRSTSVQISTFFGLALLALLWLTVIMLLSSDGSSLLLGLGYALLVAAIGITSYPVFTGVGGALLTRFGIRDYVSWRERHVPDEVPPAPAPPPLQEPPPLLTPRPLSPPPLPPERVE